MNDVFNILNGRHMKEPVTPELWKNGSLKTLQLFLSMIDDTFSVIKGCKDKQGFAANTTLQAWRMTIRSAIALVEECFASGYKFVLTSRFNQDPIEVRSLLIFGLHGLIHVNCC